MHRPAICILLTLVLCAPLFAQRDRAVGKVRLDSAVLPELSNSVDLYETSHALIIGVSDYTNGWTALPGVRDDVVAVRQVLENHGFEVETVMDPNGDALNDAYREFIARHGWRQNARLLFYFAGHGHTRETNWGGSSGYLVSTDAPLPGRDWPGFRSRALNLNQIQSYKATCATSTPPMCCSSSTPAFPGRS